MTNQEAGAALPIAESWLPVVGYDGLYEVSDLGRVRSLPRQRTAGGILRPGTTYGYHRVSLSDGNVRRNLLVHRIVLLAFVGEPPEGFQAAHRNGDRTDNRLANLYWATREENTQDRHEHGKFRRAMDAKKVLTDAEAEFIRKHHKIIKQTDLAAMFGVHRATVQRIHSGQRYALLAKLEAGDTQP
jgi:hypothetical protein